MRRNPGSALLLTAVLPVLAGCAGMGRTAGPLVGPCIDPPAAPVAVPYRGERLDFVVPVFDPGLPGDPDD